MFNKISLAGEWDFTFEDGSMTKLSVPGCFDLSEQFRFKRGKGTYSRKVCEVSNYRRKDVSYR